MKKIEVYDMNGPEQFMQNPLLVFDALRLERTLQAFENENIEVGLYSLSSHPKEFMSNTLAIEALESDSSRFPLIFVDGELKKDKLYPSREEFAKWSGIELAQIPEDPEIAEVSAFLSMISGGSSCAGGCGSCSGCGSFSDEEDED